jgi:hypothetical protein
LVLRKKLSLIHFVTGKPATRVYLFKPTHQGIKFLDVSFSGGELFELFAEGGIESPTLGTSQGASPFDEIAVSAKSDVLPTDEVYTTLVLDTRLTSGPKADDGEVAAGLGALFAVAEEEIGAAGGTEVANEDVLGAEAGGEELGAIGFAEVQEDVFGRGLVAWGHPIEPLDGIGFVAGTEFVEPAGGIGKLGVELGGDFGADLVTAAADRGADGGEQVGGFGFEVHLHLADSFDGDAGEGAAPSGVDGGYGAVFGVDEEHGDAVRGLDAEEEAGAVGGGGVPFAGLVGGGVE